MIFCIVLCLVIVFYASIISWFSQGIRDTRSGIAQLKDFVYYNFNELLLYVALTLFATSILVASVVGLVILLSKTNTKKRLDKSEIKEEVAHPIKEKKQ